MKVTQNDSQFAIHSGTFKQRVSGLFFALIGVGIFIISQKASSTNSTGNPIWLTGLGGVFIVLGIVMFVLAKTQTTTFSKTGPSEVSQKGLFGGKSQQFNSGDVTSIINATSIGNPTATMNNNMGPQRRSTLMLQFKDGSTLVLAQSSRSANNFSMGGLPIGAMIQRSPYSKLAEQLGTFLGVPVQQGPDNPAAMVKAAVEDIVQSVHLTPFNPAEPASPPNVPPPTQPLVVAEPNPVLSAQPSTAQAPSSGQPLAPVQAGTAVPPDTPPQQQ